MTKLILLLIFTFSIFSCGGLVTKPSLDSITSIQSAKINDSKKPLTVEYRVYQKTKRSLPNKTYYNFYDDDQLTKAVANRLAMYKSDETTYSEYKNDFGSLSFEGASEENMNNVTKPKFPIQADYLIQLEFNHEYEGYHSGVEYLVLFHALSLGFIPMSYPLVDLIKTTVYSKEGKILDEKQTLNTSRVWYWTPLVLVNGFHLFQKEATVVKAVHDISIDHAIYKFDK